VQELDKSFAERKQLLTVAQKLDTEIAQLERERTVDHKELVAENCSGISTIGKFKSPPSSRKRRPAKRGLDGLVASQQSKALAALFSADVQKHPGKISNLLEAQLNSVTESFSPVIRSDQADLQVSVAAATSKSFGLNAGAANRAVNGDVLIQRNAKPSDVNFDGPRAVAVGGRRIRAVDNRPGSSSSTDSAESVRHLEQGTCISNFDPYTRNGGALVTSGETVVFPPSSGFQSRGLVTLLPPASSGVSFPSSRSELEQYKLMVHGSASVNNNVTGSLPVAPTASAESKPAPKRGRKRTSDPTSNAELMQNSVSTSLLNLANVTSLSIASQSPLNMSLSSQVTDLSQSRQFTLPSHLEGITRVIISELCYNFHFHKPRERAFRLELLDSVICTV
jgi:hypothetical protein